MSWPKDKIRSIIGIVKRQFTSLYLFRCHLTALAFLGVFLLSFHRKMISRRDETADQLVRFYLYLSFFSFDVFVIQVDSC